MSRIEELPDNFDESLYLNDPAPGLSADSPKNSKSKLKLASQSRNKDEIPEYSPAAAPPLSTQEDITTILNKTPLFMNSLDNAADDEGENVHLDALRALQYEGTRAEIAQGFKDRGNESVADKAWSNAREFYSKGLAVLTAKDGLWEKPTDLALEAAKQKQLEETLKVNRAMVHLELKNYRSTILDCVAALKLNPANVKSHYRCASALLALEKYDESLIICWKGLELDNSNLALKKLLEKIKTGKEAFEARSAKRKAEQRRKERERVTLDTALKARGLKVRNTNKPPDLEDAVIRLDPDALSPESELVFPVFFLYPIHGQSDFIKSFRETESVANHLDYILPLPWDEQRLYSLATVDCYMDTVNGGLVKAGKKLSLLKLLNEGNIEIVDGLLKIHVVPSKMATKWIADIKAKKSG